jgi:plastocyanin
VNVVRPGWARRGTRAVAVASLLAVAAVGCGGGGDDDGGQRYVEPKGPAQESIDIDAKNFSFSPDAITVAPGIAEITLTSTGGLHDLVFDGAFDGFRLEVGTDDSDSKKLDLEAGTYTFYCSLSGHRAAGMEGTLTVK